MDAIPLVFLFGPTGVGKTDLLASTFSRGFEVISADSMQVYRRFSIGTAKPDRDLLDRLPHYLIDIIDPILPFSAGDFVRLADEAVSKILENGHIPLMSGGTAFYFRSFMFGLPQLPSADSKIRDELDQECAEKGHEALYCELQRVDPERASQLHPNDLVRIQRSLEIFRITGKPHSSFAPSMDPREGYRFLCLGLRRDRQELYARINQRVDLMFDYGLEQEVASLIAAGFNAKTPAMKGIGYREFFTDPGNERESIKRNSRRYAKRQITFFASLPDVRWFHPDERSKIEECVRNFLFAEKLPIV
ncbi:tRNA delta(2)-isopentenylpyrophosphate transferase [Sediminispirochaeta smaragdinae DSM 11293]|uniref:tRNA dimethylallyltransferase n=1 Tax=Sediminispirochaeta smaragdinae (strain DSM 11293 / JCM 15392 / SEBR 4228) TaxID=573413 RepID=E1R766_SEDSS|nr:tRNA delta(2)-isopentenylpyrophosphate transferase [Sediminispirochaeta smaragdinae DSM 11293]